MRSVYATTYIIRRACSRRTKMCALLIYEPKSVSRDDNCKPSCFSQGVRHHRYPAPFQRAAVNHIRKDSSAFILRTHELSYESDLLRKAIIVRTWPSPQTFLSIVHVEVRYCQGNFMYVIDSKAITCKRESTRFDDIHDQNGSARAELARKSTELPAIIIFRSGWSVPIQIGFGKSTTTQAVGFFRKGSVHLHGRDYPTQSTHIATRN